MFLKRSSFVSTSLAIYKSSNYLIIFFFIYEFFWRFNIKLLIVDIENTSSLFFFKVKLNNCPWSWLGSQRYVGMIDLQVADANVITAVCKAKVPMVEDNRMTKERFLRASQVVIGNPSLDKIVRVAYDSHDKRLMLHSQSLQHDF